MADAPEVVSIQSPSHQPGGLSSTKSFRKSLHINSDKKDAETTDVDNSPPEKKSSWSGRKYWGLIVLACAIIAAAVGGGIGGALAVQHAKAKMHSDTQCDVQQLASSIPATVTVVATVEASSTSTTSSSAAPSTLPSLDPDKIERVDISCPWQFMSSWRNDDFQCLEKTVPPAENMEKLTGITSYTLRTCIDACSTWNQYHSSGERCHLVSMEWDLSYAYQNNEGANCFLLRFLDDNTDPSIYFDVNVTTLIISG